MDKRISKKLLHKYYIIDKKSSDIIAKVFKVSGRTILNYLHKYKIKLRTNSENGKLQKRYLKYSNILTYDYLYNQYINNKKSCRQISIEIKIEKSIIYKRIKKLGIPLRSRIVAKTGEFCTEETRLKLSKSLKGKFLREENPNFGNKWSSEQKKKQSKLMIKIMSNPEIKTKMLGKNNPCWIDGRSFYPYPAEFNYILKEQIRNRDNHECQNCGMTEEEHLSKYEKVLDVHHIDYNKENLKEYNLISLCHPCNAIANYNRKHWENFYINILNEKYYDRKKN
jgi:hypothetical protein